MRSLNQVDAERIANQLSKDGYVVFRNAVSKADLTALKDRIYGRFVADKSSGLLFSGGGGISGHLNCFPGKDSRCAYEQLQEYGLIDVISSMAPSKVGALRVNCNYNLPKSVAQHYHMDGIYTEDFLICNVAVVDTDLENGALDVLPGTNQQFYKFWQYALQRKYRLSTRLVLGQGDVVLRKSTLWHRGMPNRSDVPRPMLAFTFGETSAPQDDPFLKNGGEIGFEPNWYRTDKLSQLRERAFVKAPLLYSSYRFTRSLYGNKGYSNWK